MSLELYTQLVSSVVFPLHERLKGHTSVTVRESLEESQWWPAERLKELQLQRLRRLLQRADDSETPLLHYLSAARAAQARSGSFCAAASR